MENGSGLRKGREPEVGGGKRRRSLYLPLAILIFLALSCVIIATMASLVPAPFSPPLPGGYEAAEPVKGLHGESADGIPGFRIHGEAVEALNMAPGGRVTSDLTVENLGPGAMRVVVTARVVSDNGLCEALQVSLHLTGQDSSEASEVIYSGPLTGLRRKPDRGLPLPAEGSAHLTWSVYFPLESGNEYQAVECQADFVFETQQT